jgi:hypothetical protein
MKIKRASLTLYIIYGIWISLLLILFLYLNWMKQEGAVEIKDETPNTLKKTNNNSGVSKFFVS